ncbi:MAG: rhombosortase [Hyphomicrobiaceae bacterium]|nr:rhombosortase [Hyphomicrobiaceae bacterium]
MTFLRALTHGRFRLPWVTLILAGICVGLFALFGGTPKFLVYDRPAILNGAWWRLVTGHLVHLDMQHLATNVGALLALGILYETSDFGGPARLAFGVAIFSGFVISAALFFGAPGTAYYCGFSAILNALYVATTLGMWRETGNRLWIAAFALGIAKIGWEAAIGPIFSSSLAWPPHIGAHVAGGVAGCLLAGWHALHDGPKFRAIPSGKQPQTKAIATSLNSHAY